MKQNKNFYSKWLSIRSGYRYLFFALALSYMGIPLNACSFLFWQEQINHHPGVWLSNSNEFYYEPGFKFERKKNKIMPGDMSVNTRNMESWITEYKINKDVIESKQEIHRIKGSIQPDNFIVSHDWIIYIHKSNHIDDASLYVLSRKKNASNPGLPSILKIKDSPLIQIGLSNDERYISIMIFDDSGLSLQFIKLDQNAKQLSKKTQSIKLESKGLPQAIWWDNFRSQGQSFYIRDKTRVLRINPIDKIVKTAQKFPRCFYLKKFGSQNSTTGLQVFRSENEPEPALRKVHANKKRFHQSAISIFSELGKNCP